MGTTAVERIAVECTVVVIHPVSRHTQPSSPTVKLEHLSDSSNIESRLSVGRKFVRLNDSSSAIADRDGLVKKCSD